MKKFTVDKKTNLKSFTDSVYPQGSFYFHALLRAKDIKVNGVRIGGDIPVKPGDEVVYYTDAKQEGLISHYKVYEDDHVIIVDKLDGVDTSALCSELSSVFWEVFPVHRLDRNTRGLVTFAKNKAAEKELLAAFKERRVEKIYLAQCKNNFKKDSAKLVAYLIKYSKTSAVKVYAQPVEGAEEIRTDYRLLKDLGDVAEIEVTLHTGKTHQIRAHMAFIGCPVLGDGKYGDGVLNSKYSSKRQRLISKRLKFSFPSGDLRYLDGKEFISNFDFENQ